MTAPSSRDGSPEEKLIPVAPESASEGGNQVSAPPPDDEWLLAARTELEGALRTLMTGFKALVAYHGAALERDG